MAHQVPDIGPHSELVDFSDVYGDAHGIDPNFSIICCVLRRIFIYMALVLAARSIAQADSSTVLAFPFEKQSNDRTLDWIGEGISECINERLQPEPGVVLFGDAIRELHDMVRIFPDSTEARSLLTEVDRQRNLK